MPESSPGAFALCPPPPTRSPAPPAAPFPLSAPGAAGGSGTITMASPPPPPPLLWSGGSDGGERQRGPSAAPEGTGLGPGAGRCRLTAGCDHPPGAGGRRVGPRSVLGPPQLTPKGQAGEKPLKGPRTRAPAARRGLGWGAARAQARA